MLCKEPDASSQYHSILKHRPPALLLKGDWHTYLMLYFICSFKKGFTWSYMRM